MILNLSKTTIQTKIFMFSTLTVFFGLILFATIFLNNYNIYQETQKVKKLVDLSTKISALVHEFQKERGMSAGFIGSNGNKFKLKLVTQRELSSSKLKILKNALKENNYSSYGSNISLGLKSIDTFFSQLANIRSRVSDLKIKVKEQVAFYSNMNDALIKIINHFSKKIINPSISTKLYAYVNFLFGKERAGIERAVLSNVFAKNKFDEGEYAKFVSLVSAQDTYLNMFKNFANSKISVFFNKEMTGTHIDNVNEYRSAAHNNYTQGNFSKDPVKWFDIITIKINHLKKVDDFIAQLILTEGKDLGSVAKAKLLTIIIFSIIFLVALCALVYAFTKSISGAIKQVMASIEAITNNIIKGDLSVRGKTEKVSVDFKKTIEKINELMNAFLVPLEESIKVLDQFSKKDLCSRMTGDYQGDFKKFKNNINYVGDKLQESLVHVQVASKQIHEGSTLVADSSQTLAAGTSEQAASLEEITSSMTEVANQTKQNAKNATNVKKLTVDSRNTAENGNKQMQSLLTSMSEITKSGENIQKIVKVIDEIAFQTNLLALNAAVEAARAGKHGKGFAVVAEEVRNLAARSANAAKETTGIIEDSNKKTKRGEETAESTAKLLIDIVEGAVEVADIVGNIADASNQQSEGIAQITIALSQIDTVTQTNAATAESSASASEELSGQASELNKMVTEFKLS